MKRAHILGSILVAAGLAMSTSSYFQGQLAQAKTYNYKVATIKQEPYVLLNDDEGKTIVDRALLAGTDWQVGKIADLNHNGTLYYQVSTHEWVNSAAVQANFDPQTGTLLTGEMQPNKTHSNTTQPNQALIGKINSTVVEVYTNNGQTVNTGDPRFTMNSAWKVNRVVKNSQGKSFYLVGNDTWISSDDMELNQAPQNVENIPNFGIINSNTSGSNSNNSSTNTNNSGNVNNGSGSNNTASNSITHEPESAYQSAIIDAINTKRSALGLPPLTVSAKLTRAATIRTSEQYNTNQRETRPTRPDGSNWWSVLSEVDYDWSYARENNFVITDSTTKREAYRYPENIASGLMSLYSDTYEGNYLSPKAKEIGVSVRYNDDSSKIFTIIEVGAPR